MGRTKNDGRGKTGGRAKGTPNKITSTLKEFISGVIDDNREQILKDLKMLEPKERLMILERLMGYVIPKQQAIGANIESTCSHRELSMEEAQEFLRQLEASC